MTPRESTALNRTGGIRSFGALVLMISSFSSVGCVSHKTLPPIQQADRVTMTIGSSYPEPEPYEIKDRERVEKLTAFVNSLPNKWSIPWYGPPVGKVYFKFYAGQKPVGNFYVGPYFFGRGRGNFWSQRANRAQIDELSRLIDFDLWSFLKATK